MVHIDEELDVDYDGDGGFHTYHVVGEGSTEEDFYKDAGVFEINQDGGEGRGYPLSKASNAVIDAALKLFNKALKEEKEPV